MRPKRPQQGAGPIKRSTITPNQEQKYPSQRGASKFDGRTAIVRGALESNVGVLLQERHDVTSEYDPREERVNVDTKASSHEIGRSGSLDGRLLYTVEMRPHPLVEAATFVCER